MTNTPITLHDLRERIYVKAKADKTWRFWGLYVHVCKMETLLEAYVMAWKNDGAPGIDGVTFKDIEESGEQGFPGLTVQHRTGRRKYRRIRGNSVR
jgi:RNA-directed DNA polymerase